jgi:2,4-diaminopentanoate dehydrogenase
VNSDPLRIALWGTGHMGVELIRAAVERGDTTLAGAIVTDPAKEGRDLGDIAGLDRQLGATATLDADAVLARDDVDVVFFTGAGGTVEIASSMARIAEAGKDAVTFSAIAHPATALGPKIAKELNEVARESGVRMVGTGLAPGFLLDVLPVALASTCVTWSSISARVVIPMNDWGAMTLDAYGIGKTAGEHAPPGSRLSFLECVGTIVDALGLEAAETRQIWQPLLSGRRREGGAAVVEPGKVSGVHRTYSVTTTNGRVITVELIAIYMLDEELDGVSPECTITIEGSPSSNVKATLTGGWVPDPYPATAAVGLNCLSGLRSLPPGLYNAAQIPFAVTRPDWPSAEV